MSQQNPTKTEQRYRCFFMPWPLDIDAGLPALGRQAAGDFIGPGLVDYAATGASDDLIAASLECTSERFQRLLDETPGARLLLNQQRASNRIRVLSDLRNTAGANVDSAKLWLELTSAEGK